jgi:hypothetical protein
VYFCAGMGTDSDGNKRSFPFLYLTNAEDESEFYSGHEYLQDGLSKYAWDYLQFPQQNLSPLAIHEQLYVPELPFY